MSGAAAIDALRIDALLPQTQCTRCGYCGCRPYAEAIADGSADINQCPPGGSRTIDRLAMLLHRPSKALNPANGREEPTKVARIDAARCIGCAKCLPPCPVDAILGAAKYLHAVLADRCTGCELCIAPCPVDCIQMVPAPGGRPEIEPAANRHRFAAHVEREQRRDEERRVALQSKKSALRSGAPVP